MTDQNAESYEIKSKDKPRFSMNRRVYKGVVMFDNEAELIETMDTRQDDIWVCSYPRSGTTLTQEMTYLVKTLDFETALTKQLDERFPIIDIKDDRFPYYKGVKHFDEMKSPRLIKSHLPYFLLPQQLKDGKGKIIYIARNAKDVVTSFYHLLLWGDELKESDNTWDLFLDSFMNGTGVQGFWPKHVLGYWEASRRSDKIMFLQYEEVVKSLPNTCHKIAEFLDRKLTDDEITRICQHCHVDNMRNNDHVNGTYWKTFKRMNDDSAGRFINKGKAGAWKSLLSPETAKRIDVLIENVRKGGLDIPDE
ncbi:ST1A1-like protein [Mya arenaria]|uniref:ST1A1-like protein n=1 Tax=Mya arenaria TaxID=6604 RepID=A0ABY7ESW2_MYAAR|nr:sulfotransferase 1E1-like [Mya arenaria]XP_052816527.1 sulfotransferase 1E1-like [Mya arenaria]XP_052816528.1 sulfotransferase 1E1-like [Mya arenaria]XP_052819081.1 sulfotransferase 1E1-like [Mya arenaria]XP_052819082.1 sulfotransferase 1E1-like [Mya arenaria]XP_052819083.1 sulfotransferase 1E1-like [Mya arenaria]XP_052819084.1 sulfotransferase 1E1-like [Mya arenaria]WAR13048.1 ST1A1-like protein [Mya arenaria]